MGDGSRLISDVPWEDMNSNLVSTDLKQTLTAAAFIESRGDDYGNYLTQVFSNDQEFVKVIRKWSGEENEHGIALSTWLERANPDFDFKGAFEGFLNLTKLSYATEEVEGSIRGSKSAELLSRCAVESGTSTYYRSIAERVGDPALTVICEQLSKDEINHYNIFRKKLLELRISEKWSSFQFLRLSISRLFEVEDDQMSYAYYVARGTGEKYDKKYHPRLLIRNLYKTYTRNNIRSLIKLNLNSVGIANSKFVNVMGYDRLVSFLTSLTCRYIRLRIWLIDWQIDLRRIWGWVRS